MISKTGSRKPDAYINCMHRIKNAVPYSTEITPTLIGIKIAVIDPSDRSEYGATLCGVCGRTQSWIWRKANH